MPFEKGKSGNKNGRPKGSKGKRTKIWESLMDDIMGQHTEAFNKQLQELWENKPADAMMYYLKILEYAKPKLRNTEITEHDHKIEVHYVKPDEN